MTTLRGTYVHRGDGIRRRKRAKQTFLVVSFLAASAFLIGSKDPAATEAEAAGRVKWRIYSPGGCTDGQQPRMLGR